MWRHLIVGTLLLMSGQIVNPGGGGSGVQSLTTTGTSGASTLVGTTLNVPVYSSGAGTPGLFSGLITLPTIASTGLTTAYNQGGTFSITDVGNGVKLTDTASAGGYSMEGAVKAYPTPPFTLTALVSISANVNFNANGILVANTTVGNAMTFGIQLQSFRVITSTSPTQGTSIVNTAFPVMNQGPFIWLKYFDDGTNITYSYSPDGANYYQVYTIAKSASFLGSSGFNFIGFQQSNQSHATSSVIHSWVIQ